MAGASSDGERAMLLLKEKEGERVLPVMMSTRRAVLLMMRSKLPLPMPIPMTVADMSHQLMSKFGIRITRVELTAVKDGTFFSRVVGERDGEEKEVDFCQAPDGLVMAMTALCPILIEEELLEAQYMHKMGDNTFAININTMSRSMLEDALRHAVESENYEAASHLRDELAKRSPEKQ